MCFHYSDDPGKAALSILLNHHFTIIKKEVREKTTKWLFKQCEQWWREYDSKASIFYLNHWFFNIR